MIQSRAPHSHTLLPSNTRPNPSWRHGIVHAPPPHSAALLVLDALDLVLLLLERGVDGLLLLLLRALDVCV